MGEPTQPTQPTGRPQRQAAFGFIFATSLMNAISFGIMIPILPNLIKQFTGGDYAQASLTNVLFASVWGLMQFFCGPVLGLLSDRIGRRPVLLISLFGLAVDFLFMALAPSLSWLFVGRIINGMTAASFSTAGAYVADVTPPEQRAKTFGVLGSAFSFGFLIGPALGGLLSHDSLRLPFFVAAGLTTINWIYGLFVLPESLPPERRIKRFDWRRANPIGSLKFLGAHAELLNLAFINFLFYLAQNVLPSIFVLYAGYRYHWSPMIMGLTLMGTGALGVAVQLLLVGPIVSRIGERNTLLLGAFGGAIGFALYGFAPTGTIYLAAAPIFALMNLMQPGLQGLMTRRVGPQEQGQLQGANQSLQGISSIIGPLIFGTLFAWAVKHDATWHAPGLPIFLASGLLVIAFIFGLRVNRGLGPVAESAGRT